MAEAGKVCSVCDETKPAAEFSKKQWAAKAHSRKCKACTEQGEDSGGTGASHDAAAASQPPAAPAPAVPTGPVVDCGACGSAISKKSAGKCAKCLAEFYCNVACQRGHWKAHKDSCGAKCYMCLKPFSDREVDAWSCCQRKICADCVMINFCMLPPQCEMCLRKQEQGAADDLFAEGLELQSRAKELAEKEEGKPGAHSKASSKVFELAAAKYKQALQVNPKVRFAQCNLGTVYFELGRYQEAGPHLRKAIAQEPTDAKAHYVMGVVCALAQNREDAVQYLARAVRLIQKVDASELEREIIEDYEVTHREVLSGDFFPPPELRFKVGDKVQCRCREGWRNGVVADLWYREEDWPPERNSAPYQVALDRVGTLIFAQFDHDSCIRHRQ